MISLFLIFFLIMGSVLLYFYFKNKSIRLAHLQKERGYIEAFNSHSRQIIFRKNGFNKYDFIKYNLSEALIIQPEINI
jgi:hypothetical protein